MRSKKAQYGKATHTKNNMSLLRLNNYKIQVLMLTVRRVEAESTQPIQGY